LTQKVVGVIALHVDAVETGKAPDIRLLAEIVEFLRVYADQYHHAKEEDLLFPALERNGVPAQGCPLGALKHEHVAGRALVTDLATIVTDSRAGVDVSRQALVKCLQGLVALYPSHIWKEDYLLFPMTRKVLDDLEQSRLAAEFDSVDATFGPEKLRHFEEWADALSIP
jgi:hemerythrin-like domain-containing protein